MSTITRLADALSPKTLAAIRALLPDAPDATTAAFLAAVARLGSRDPVPGAPEPVPQRVPLEVPSGGGYLRPSTLLRKKRKKGKGK